MKENIRKAIREGNTALGIELGSTRIKAVLVDENHNPIASGSHDWENRYEDGIWTYSLEDIWKGVKHSYKEMADSVKEQYGETLTTIGGICFSAMMHGYMVFDKSGDLLVPFRTWRNTITEEASKELTRLFSFQVPQRWSIAHLYQAILNEEAHVSQIDYMITLEGYVHWKLTGKRVLGIGDCAGMFPVDSEKKEFNAHMVKQFDDLISSKQFPWKLRDIMPEVLTAGEPAGVLTKEGALLLDPTGQLQPGIPFCPPEGDAGTGMTATNSVGKRTGNVSAGTSVFAMVVLEKALSKVYQEIDMVTTPAGDPVAMVHCNNCTSDLNAWVSLFEEFAEAIGVKVDKNDLFTTLYQKALEGEKDGGGLFSCCYLSGEHITHFEEGRPLFVRTPDSRFNLANFMRTHLYSSLATLATGMEILFLEGVKLNVLLGHGGLFKTQGVGQSLMAAAMGVPVSVMETAGEGGAWGAALLASYMIRKGEEESLEQYLRNHVFRDMTGTILEPDPEDEAGYAEFMKRYKRGLVVERAAVDSL
ncbi:FGGY-family carbohydrate kinase [Clostridium sp. E02]|uniref:xylulokinase n=1 Tax=Clostridium sp. E02 TaxID=2487134 RepID=UPI000F51B751|nr:FGGY-family carbohydrate kinase [Clostridium sp. E02]